MESVNPQAICGIRASVTDGTPDDVVERYESLRGVAERVDFGDLDHDVVVVDTETTGFSFNHDELIQIAAARMKGAEIVDWYVTFVNPGHAIPDDIVHLTGISDEDVADAPTPQEALTRLVEFVGGSYVVAHNVGFDKTFTTRHPEGYPLLENVWIDSLDLSRIAIPRMKSHRLIDLVHAFGAPVSTHRADEDVAATCVVYRLLLAAVYSMPRDLVAEIAGMATPEEWSTVAVFQQIAGLQESEQQEDAQQRKLFSLRSMRSRRVKALPQRLARNDAESIAADPMQALDYPSDGEVAQAFDADGLLGAIYGTYEPREEQREMALAINRAFAASENLVVEAGTGVGKSMAYLVPAALFAKRNKVAVGIATKTNALLDQLVFKELPALAGAMTDACPDEEPLTWASLKGMAHYPCLRKVGRLVDAGPAMRETPQGPAHQAPALAAMLSYIDQSEFDDMDTLKTDWRVLPKYLVTSTSNECLKRKCPYYGTLCFAHGARRRAESADIMVTNHTMLFCNLAADGALLPTSRHWVIDEAHGAEEEARQAFTQSVSSEDIMRVAGKVGDAAGNRNVFEHAERALSGVEGAQVTLFFGLARKAREAGNAYSQIAEEFTKHVKDLLYFDPSKQSKAYDHVDLWVNAEVRASAVFGDLRVLAATFVEACDKLITAAQELVAYLEGIDEAAVAQREVATVAMELREQRNAAELFFEVAPETYAYQASLVKKKDRRVDKLDALLLDVGDKMNETLFASTHSVIFTSATLAISGKFDAFANSMGLNRGELSHATALQLDSSYDFDNNMIVYVVKDIPEPTDRRYLSALQDLLVRVHLAQQGSLLTLFTNRREMEQCFDAVQPELKASDLRLVCQKWGVSVKSLRDDFLADEHLSLFALKSFWQGFDAPGSTLKGVVIPKLPFARPTDPLYCERASRDDNAWRHYVLPQAVIETKQAAGRLIRKADDHGVLILADKRLLTKNYGKTFLNSLQSKTVRVCTVDEIVRSLEAFRAW